jgi:8-amino-7-oxononanoate synthase
MSRFFYFSKNLISLTPKQFIQEKLQNRQDAGLYRQLRINEQLIDFCSNDYLGFAHSPKLAQLIQNEVTNYSGLPNGSTGSRLLAGNTS